MNNNDILRSLRYTFDYNDASMIEIFGLGDLSVSRSEVSDWLKKDDDSEAKPLNDQVLAIFLNGLINLKRGKREGSPLEAEKILNNNIILRKLKIALNLRDEEMLEMLKMAGRNISKHELSAFFRKPDQAQYRPCMDQILRNFLQGMQINYRVEQ